MMKTQTIRLADVFFIGPIMVYGGYRLCQQNSKWVGWTLMLLGVSTTIYNARNYILFARTGG